MEDDMDERTHRRRVGIALLVCLGIVIVALRFTYTSLSETQLFLAFWWAWALIAAAVVGVLAWMGAQ
jgi:hypothetical protein